MSTTSTVTAAYLDHKVAFYDRLIELGYSVSFASHMGPASQWFCQ